MTMGVGRILTTHTGSLPRPADLVQMMWEKADGVPVDEAALARRVATAVGEVVDKQLAAGVAIVNDGEMSKPSYATYIQDRLNGFDGESVTTYFFQDLVDYPRSADLVAANPGRRKRTAPACTAAISVKDDDAVAGDLANLERALANAGDVSRGMAGTFSSAASPGVVALFFGNELYPTYEEYVFAIAEAMRHEYEELAAGGLTVQLDCPDLAMGRHSAYAEMDLPDFRRRAALNIEALNHALRNIPAERLRMHVCWGNYPGPHHRDVDLADLIDLVWTRSPRPSSSKRPTHGTPTSGRCSSGSRCPMTRSSARVSSSRSRTTSSTPSSLRSGSCATPISSAGIASWRASTAVSASTSACRASTRTWRGPSSARWRRARSWRAPVSGSSRGTLPIARRP